MNNMERRRILLLLPALPVLLRGQDSVVRGKLSASPSGAPGLTVEGGKFVPLSGDPDTKASLRMPGWSGPISKWWGGSRRRQVSDQSDPHARSVHLQNGQTSDGDVLVRCVRDPHLHTRNLLVLPGRD